MVLQTEKRREGTRIDVTSTKTHIRQSGVPWGSDGLYSIKPTYDISYPRNVIPERRRGTKQTKTVPMMMMMWT